METLRAVLGLAAPESADKNTDDIEDGLKSSRKNGPEDDGKFQERSEHAFLDRDYGLLFCVNDGSCLSTKLNAKRQWCFWCSSICWVRLGFESFPMERSCCWKG